MVLQILMAVVFSAVVSYLLGSCNSSIIVVKLLKGEDIRSSAALMPDLPIH